MRSVNKIHRTMTSTRRELICSVERARNPRAYIQYYCSILKCIYFCIYVV